MIRSTKNKFARKKNGSFETDATKKKTKYRYVEISIMFHNGQWRLASNDLTFFQEKGKHTNKKQTNKQTKHDRNSHFEWPCQMQGTFVSRKKSTLIGPTGKALAQSRPLLSQVRFSCFFLVLPSFSWFHLVVPRFSWFYLVFIYLLPSFTLFFLIYPVLPSFSWLYLVLPSYSWFYLVLPSFTQFFLVIPSLTLFSWFTQFSWLYLFFTQSFMVLPSVTQCYPVLLICYPVSPIFSWFDLV